MEVEVWVVEILKEEMDFDCCWVKCKWLLCMFEMVVLGVNFNCIVDLEI